MNSPVVELETNRLSGYRTKSRFLHYGEITSVAGYRAFVAWAEKNQKSIYLLGNGSNTHFARSVIRTLVLKNKLPRKIEFLGDDLFRISSSVLVSEILKRCLSEKRECFYFLASVPAEIGGALAMNAGQGWHMQQTIYDYVVEVTYTDGERTVTLPRNEIPLQYRRTPFTGLQGKLIASGTFRFPVSESLAGRNPIKERIEWARDHQDLTAPNCGSVFKDSTGGIMHRIRGLSLLGAQFSRRTDNWLLNRSENPLGLNALIWTAKSLHRMAFRRAALEIIVVK